MTCVSRKLAARTVTASRRKPTHSACAVAVSWALPTVASCTSSADACAKSEYEAALSCVTGVVVAVAAALTAPITCSSALRKRHANGSVAVSAPPPRWDACAAARSASATVGTSGRTAATTSAHLDATPRTTPPFPFCAPANAAGTPSRSSCSPAANVWWPTSDVTATPLLRGAAPAAAAAAEGGAAAVRSSKSGLAVVFAVRSHNIRASITARVTSRIADSCSLLVAFPAGVRGALEGLFFLLLLALSQRRPRAALATTHASCNTSPRRAKPTGDRKDFTTRLPLRPGVSSSSSPKRRSSRRQSA
ncbi:hypothetical protein DQ04_04081040 [Trypanosoma grayi]|uniref:hypothetical protein n=1 Tax=Trypanosoma grayi TaxID=71804 RepID=UPI0004F480DF|nr:hypothetical protein DQ04_04081040 [Trypanosoma grayi]KEG10179.1 hypothetical protein DQ04_04081040 [Trypanosoma grayi]